MCQLLGMNCNVPTDICFSFEGFRARGGRTDQHSDGWGIAFFEDQGCRLFLDDRPSAESAIAELVRSYPIRSLNVIAHIRKATHGHVALQNTHPFQRELWGCYWVFAHNGELKDFTPAGNGRFRPVGNTDSETAFCHILNTLQQQYPQQQPTPVELLKSLRKISNEIACHGMFNFLLSNGELLFAYCATDLNYVLRKAPFCTAHLIDEDISVDFNELTAPDDRVALIATLPLTDNENWTKMARGELLAFHHGRVLARG